MIELTLILFGGLGAAYVCFLLGVRKGKLIAQKEDSENFKSILGDQWRNIIFRITPEYLQESKDTETKMKAYRSALKHLGYAIHHLGHDISFGRQQGIVSSNSQELKKQKGEIISQVGTYFRLIDGHGNTPFEKKTPKEVAQIFLECIDNKPITEDFEKFMTTAT